MHSKDFRLEVSNEIHSAQNLNYWENFRELFKIIGCCVVVITSAQTMQDYSKIHLCLNVTKREHIWKERLFRWHQRNFKNHCGSNMKTNTAGDLDNALEESHEDKNISQVVGLKMWRPQGQMTILLDMTQKWCSSLRPYNKRNTSKVQLCISER